MTRETAGLAIGFAAAATLAAGCTIGVNVGGDPSRGGIPTCEPSRSARADDFSPALALIAQSVRDAEWLPCIGGLPIGWVFRGLDVNERRAQFWLSSDRDGDKAVRVSLADRCDTSGAVETASPRSGVQRLDRVQSVKSGYRGDRYFVFRGGCITYHFDLRGQTGSEPVAAVAASLGLVSREELAHAVHEYSGGRFELDPTPAQAAPS